jgi:hypothetical protein
VAGDVVTAPLGTYHPRDRCGYCGDRRGPLEMRILPATRAWAWVCTNTPACVRRTTRQRQLRLFGKAS